MKAFVHVSAGLMTLAACAAAQENIPDAAPVADGPLVANPEQDSLDMADMLYKQAQEPQTKANPQEYARLIDLSLRKYLEFSQRFPHSAQAPLAQYRAAMCLEELGRKADAHGLFIRLTQTGSPSLAAASAYRLATDAAAAGETEKSIQYYQMVIRHAEQNDLKVDAQYRLGRLFLSSGNPDAAATMFCAVIGNPQADAKFVLVSRMGYAALCADTGRLGEAYAEYRKVLETPGVDNRNRGIAILQAATLATRLKKTAEAKSLYEQLLKDESLKEMAPEGRMGLLLGLYDMGKYKEILSQYEQEKGMKIIKSVRCEAEFEGRCRQNSGPRNTKPVRQPTGIRPQDRSKSNNYTELSDVNGTGAWRERLRSYPGRSHGRARHEPTAAETRPAVRSQTRP